MKLVFQRIEYGLSRFSSKFRKRMINFLRERFFTFSLYVVFYISHCQSRQVSQQCVFSLKSILSYKQKYRFVLIKTK